jgi:hypothetical protein
MYGFLADVVVALHLAFVLYVLLGQVVIVVAGALKRQWGRNPWFRWTHLASIAYVAYEAVMGIRCPLTVWEEQLRAMGGVTAATSGETFMGRITHDLLFVNQYFTNGQPPEGFFTTAYIAVFLIVAQAFVLYPPRAFRVRRRDRVAAPIAPQRHLALTR